MDLKTRFKGLQFLSAIIFRKDRKKNNNEFRHFLFIAKGSAGEVRNMMYIAKELNYLNESDFYGLLEKVITISRMISSLIKTLNGKK